MDDIIEMWEKYRQRHIRNAERDRLSERKRRHTGCGCIEIELGDAVILSNIEGKNVEEYTVEVTRIYSDFDQHGRNMMIRVTDEDLINATGGIVQGMSGSPIIQNGENNRGCDACPRKQPDKGLRHHN